MYRVGRSVVSAITHTPASGPFAPVTTPPMSSLSIATAVCAPSCAGAAVSSAATPIAATVRYSLALSLIGALLVHFWHGARGRCAARHAGAKTRLCTVHIHPAIRLPAARIGLRGLDGNGTPCPGVAVGEEGTAARS